MTRWNAPKHLPMVLLQVGAAIVAVLLVITATQREWGYTLLNLVGLIVLAVSLRQSVTLGRRERVAALQAERDQVEAAVRDRTRQLTELAHHLQTAREEERQRLAHNLHDELGALLTSAKLDAARIKSRLGDANPEASERLAHLVITLNSSIALGRRIIEDLRPSTLGHLGLAPTLEILGHEFAEQSGLKVHCMMEDVHLSAPAELMVYRLVQEAITNITKHAQARQVWLNLAARDGQVTLTVRDDGVGIDSKQSARSTYGLLGMRFRVEAEGGTLTIDSSPTQGTRLEARLPQDTSGHSTSGHSPAAEGSQNA